MTKNLTPKRKKEKIEKKKELEKNMMRVIVEYDGNYYICMPVNEKFKCGKCLFGLINPFGNMINQDDKCKRCGAKLNETIYGTNYFNMRSYSPL